MGGVITSHNQIATNEEYMSSEEQQVMDIADQETLRVSGTERGPSSGGVMMAAVSNPPAGHPDPMGAAFRASAATSPTAGVILPSAISPAECDACAAAANQRPAVAYVLGEIGYDFGTEARRDSFVQQMQPDRSPHNAAELLAHLQQDPTAAPNIIWTLSLDATVVYAIQPYGPYASVAYERLREFLDAHHTKGVERVSIPGYVKGTTKLLNGQQVPLLFPEIRGMYSWSTPHLIEAVLGAAPVEAATAQLHSEKAASIGNFLERVYYELRNLGMTSQERAMNYAATDAFRLDEVFGDSLKSDLKLDRIDTERSPICRPGSDCWDVMLTFFNPLKRLEQARRVYRMTVDVSDVIPVTVGKVRHWDMY
jgi:cyanobactin maturation PatA/PatG family protease